MSLSDVVYPGRFIVLGLTPNEKETVVIYGATGVSPDSLARKLVFREHHPFADRERGSHIIEPTIFVEPSKEGAKPENADLLFYPAMIVKDDRVCVGNGKHARALSTFSGKSSLLEAMITVHYDESSCNKGYSKPENDLNNTPRISGIVNDEEAVLGIVKGLDSDIDRQFFSFRLSKGNGRFISTYSGENISKPVQFNGEPMVLPLSDSPQENCSTFYRAFSSDIRVGVVALHYDFSSGETSFAILNRHEIEKGKAEVKV